MSFFVHLFDLTHHQSLWKISTQSGGNDDFSERDLFGSTKVFQLTSVLSHSFNDGLGTSSLDNGIDGAVVICEEKDRGITGRGFKNLTDHTRWGDHRHPFFHPIPLPLINGDTFEP